MNRNIKDLVIQFNKKKEPNKINYFYSLSDKEQNKLKEYIKEYQQNSKLYEILGLKSEVYEKTLNIKANTFPIIQNKRFLGNLNVEIIIVKRFTSNKVFRKYIKIKNMSVNEIKKFIDTFYSEYIQPNGNYHIYQPDNPQLEFNDNELINNCKLFIDTHTTPIHVQTSLNKLYETRFKSRFNNCITELKKIYKGYIDVGGDGDCYYRSVIYSLLITILFNDLYTIRNKILYINKLIEIFDVRNYSKMNTFLNFIKNNINISYIDFLENYINKDIDIILDVRKLLANNISLLSDDEKNTVISNYTVQKGISKMNNIKNSIKTHGEYAEGSIIQIGLLCKCLHLKGFVLTKCNNDILDIKIKRFHKLILPIIHIIDVGEHYGILIPINNDININSLIDNSKVRIFNSNVNEVSKKLNNAIKEGKNPQNEFSKFSNHIQEKYYKYNERLEREKRERDREKREVNEIIKMFNSIPNKK
jgi:hypothetical protein